MVTYPALEYLEKLAEYSPVLAAAVQKYHADKAQQVMRDQRMLGPSAMPAHPPVLTNEERLRRMIRGPAVQPQGSAAAAPKPQGMFSSLFSR